MAGEIFRRSFLNLSLAAILLMLTPFFSSAKGPEFIQNNGQWQSSIYARATLKEGYMYLENNKITFNLIDLSPLYKLHFHPKFSNDSLLNPICKGHAYNITFLGANKTTTAFGKSKFKNYYNFFLGNDKSKWQGHVPAFAAYVLKNIYPHINLITSTNGKNYKIEFEIAKGGDYKNIQLQYNGVKPPKIDKEGNLITKTHLGNITEHAPIAWQNINGKKQMLDCKFKIEKNVVSFKIKSKINNNYPITIDPILDFCSYSGSYADNFGMSATYDSIGDLFAGGTAFAMGYPTTIGAYDTTFYGPSGAGITDVVVSKYDSSGHFLHYSTYIGGQGAETVHSMIVNQSNQLFIFGLTGSTNFPTTATAYDTTFGGGTPLNFSYNGTNFTQGTDIYVAKFSADGSALLASTFMGGSLNDGANYGDTPPNYDTLQHNYSDQYRGEINLDKYGNVYVASCTRSHNFPTVNPIQDSIKGEQDAVAFKLNSNLSNLIWSTYLGGTKKDAAYSIKIDSSLTAYVAGGTSSTDFPTKSNAYQPTFQGGMCDGFLCKIDSTGDSLLYSTYVGTNAYDQCYFVSIDRWHDAYVVGQSLGSFPVSPGVYSNPGSGQFIAKFNDSLTSIQYSTVFGSGSGIDLSPSAFLVDYCGNIYVSGWGKSLEPWPPQPITGMPITPNAFQPQSNGTDFYLIVLKRNLSNLLYATYFGGSLSPEHVDGGTSRFDKNGVVYQSVCGGCWANSDLPTTPGAWSNTNNSSGCNNGVFKFDFEIRAKGKITATDTTGCVPFTITFANQYPNGTSFLWNFGDSTTSTQPNPTKTYNDTGTYIVTLAIRDTICGFYDTVKTTVIVIPQLQLQVSNDTTICNNIPLTLYAYTHNTADTFLWSSKNDFSDTLNNNLADSAFTFQCSQDTIIYVQVKNKYCSLVDSITIANHSIIINPSDTTICLTNKTQIHAAFSGDTNGLTINWTPTANILNGQGTPNPNVIAPQSGSNYYYVTATNGYGCTSIDSARVIYSDTGSWQFNITANPDTIIKGDTSQLNISSSNNYTFSWFPTTTLSDASSSNPSATPGTTTNYIVTISSPNGCSTDRYITVYVREVKCSNPNIFVPDAFTPNGDKKNDILYVKGSKYIKSLYFTIYDRWGEKVFETNDINKGWDGTYKGKKSSPAVYDYYLQVTCIDNQKYFKKGNITLIR